MAYSLAVRFNEWNVDKILETLTLPDLLEWSAYQELLDEPPEPPSQDDYFQMMFKAYGQQGN